MFRIIRRSNDFFISRHRPLAIGPEGKSGTPQWDTASSPVGITTKAAQDPRKVQTILEMVEAAHTDFDYYVKLRVGTEGVDYELVNGRYELLIDDPNNPKEKRGIDVFHVLVANDFYKTIQGEHLYDYADRKFSYPGYQAAFVPQVEAYQDHVNDLNRLTLEAYFKIITGEESVDYFDTFVAEFMAKGGEKILQEINDALQGGGGSQ